MGSLSGTRRAAPLAWPPGLVMAALVVALPYFAECFHYLVELGPAYLASKAWPLATLPFLVAVVGTPPLPLARLYLFLLAYALTVPPFLSMLYFEQSLVAGLGSTVKAWPLVYYFTVTGFLATVRPTGPQVRTAILALGAATLAATALAWVLVPVAWYGSDPQFSKLFLYEYERGYRIVMPAYFAFLLLLAANRRLAVRFDLRDAAILAGGFVLLFVAYKQRVAIAALMVAMLPGWRPWVRGPIRQSAVAVGAALVLGGAVLYLLLGGTGELTQSLGGSLSVRLNSTELAIRFMAQSPLRWLFGAGTTSHFSPESIQQVVGYDLFYLADIGWLGILFEYGVAGTLLLAAAYGLSWAVAGRLLRDETDPVFLSLRDYILFLILASSVYSAILAPGELATTLALIAWRARTRGAEAASATLAARS